MIGEGVGLYEIAQMDFTGGMGIVTGIDQLLRRGGELWILFRGYSAAGDFTGVSALCLLEI